jgi:hypothetical protein
MIEIVRMESRDKKIDDIFDDIDWENNCW